MTIRTEEYYTGIRVLQYTLDEDDFELFIRYCNPSTPEEKALLESHTWEDVYEQYTERSWIDEKDAIFIKDASTGVSYSLSETFTNFIEDYANEELVSDDESIEDYSAYYMVED